MSGPLSGQVAVVTGANSGVGRSATGMLLEAGARVAMVCRSRERGERALAELRADGVQVELEIADSPVRRMCGIWPLGWPPDTRRSTFW